MALLGACMAADTQMRRQHDLQQQQSAALADDYQRLEGDLEQASCTITLQTRASINRADAPSEAWAGGRGRGGEPLAGQGAWVC
jgi:hypothetical protein